MLEQAHTPIQRVIDAELFQALLVKWRNSTPRFASIPERRNENINLNKYLID